MQDIEKWPLLARLLLAPRCIFSKSPCISVKSRELPDRDLFSVSRLLSPPPPRHDCVLSVSTVSGIVPILPRVSARRTHRCQPETPNVWVRSRTAVTSLKAVFESSDVERFAWVLMEVLDGEAENMSLSCPSDTAIGTRSSCASPAGASSAYGMQSFWRVSHQTRPRKIDPTGRFNLSLYQNFAGRAQSRRYTSDVWRLGLGLCVMEQKSPSGREG